MIHFQYFRASLLLWFVVTCFPITARADAITDFNLVIAFYKQQKWAQAVEAAEEFATKYPDHERIPDTHLYRGQALVHIQKFEEAREQFFRFIKDAPNHPDLALGMYRLGECSYFLNDFPSAERDLKAFLNKFAENQLAEWGWLYLAETQYRLNKLDDAAKSFQAYLAKFPAGRLIDDAQYGLARTYEALQQSAPAIEMYQAIVDRPNSKRAPEALFNIGARHFEDGNYASAATAFEGVSQKFSVHPLSSKAELNAGYAHYHLQEFEPAIERFSAAAKDAKQATIANYWKGLSQKSLQQYTAAATTFSQALEQDPDQPLAESLVFHWADAQLREGNYVQAIELFGRNVTQWPQGELADDALHSACEAAFLLDDLDRAARMHQEFERAYPGSGLKFPQQILYGRILIAQGDEVVNNEQTAQAYFTKAANIFKEVMGRSQLPETVNEAQFHLARAQERLQDDNAVIATLNRMLQRQESLTPLIRQDTLLLKANAHLRLQDYATAAAAYQQLLTTADSPEIRLRGLSGLANAQVQLKSWQALQQTLTELATVDTQNVQFSQLSVAAGDAAFEEESWMMAANFFERVVQLGQSDEYYSVALSGLGHAYYEQEQFDAAAVAFDTLSQLPLPDRVLKSHAMYMAALSFRRAEQLEKALPIYQNTVNEFSITQQTNPTEKQLETGMNAYRAAKGGARVARELMQDDVADGLYEKAYRELKQQLPANQVELDRLINEWADLSYNNQNYARSDELYALLIKERPTSELVDDARLILAESLRFQGKVDEALAAFQLLLNDPQADDFVKQRSMVHILDIAADAGEWQQVLNAAESLSAQFPNNNHKSYVKYRLGEALLQLGEAAKATTALTELRNEISVDFAQAPIWWPEAWLLLGDALLRTKDYLALEGVVEDLRAKQPDSAVLHRADVLLGQSYEARAMFDDARTVYARVIEATVNVPTETAAEAQFRMAESLLKQKSYEAAIKEYYKVYAGYDAPTYEAAALYQAAKCEISLKNWRDATASFKTLIADFPESDYTAQARTELAEIEKNIPEVNSTEPAVQQ